MNFADITARLLAVSEEPRPWYRIIFWWELRRIVFNLIVGFAGLISLLLFVYVASKQQGDFEEGPEPFAILIFGFGANVCYTGGWIWELTARRLWKEKAVHFGPMMFSLGLLFSTLLGLLPAVFAALIWCFSAR